MEDGLTESQIAAYKEWRGKEKLKSAPSEAVLKQLLKEDKVSRVEKAAQSIPVVPKQEIVVKSPR